MESKGDLVIDSRLANEGDGWAGSGAHPWHLDDETESILFLTNMGDELCDIAFQVQAMGVHYYLSDLALNPHETKVIDLRKLRDAQKPDLDGNTIPPSATDGSLLWIRADQVPVMGRLMVLQRKKRMASNYDCTPCICPANFSSLEILPSSVTLLPRETQQLTLRAWYTDCNNVRYYLNKTSWAAWSPSSGQVAWVNNGGLVTAVGGAAAATLVLAETLRLLHGGPAFTDIKLALSVLGQRSVRQTRNYNAQDCAGLKYCDSAIAENTSP